MGSNRGRSRGFTLIEALVALVIFGIITAALSMALSTALSAQVRIAAYRRQDAEVRSVFRYLSRDFAAAYASPNDPNSMFIAGTSPQAQQNQSYDPGLVTLETMDARIPNSDPSIDPALQQGASGPGSGQFASGVSGSAGQSGNVQPSWDCALVRYSLDAQGALRRSSVAVPSVQTLQQAASESGQQPTSGIPAGIMQSNVAIAHNVKQVEFEFYDPTQQTWRSEWDFEQPQYVIYLQQQAQANSAASGSSSSASSSSAASSVSNGSSTGDNQLPPFVRVTVTMSVPNGGTKSYTSTFSVTSPQPVQPNTPPPAQSTTSGSSSGSSTSSGGL